jgi:hypothetical protein
MLPIAKAGNLKCQGDGSTVGRACRVDYCGSLRMAKGQPGATNLFTRQAWQKLGEFV